jgi:hypothetical protein
MTLVANSLKLASRNDLGRQTYGNDRPKNFEALATCENHRALDISKAQH